MSEKSPSKEEIPKEIKEKLGIGEKFATLNEILIPLGATKIVKIDDLVFQIRKIGMKEWESIGNKVKDIRNPFAIARAVLEVGGVVKPEIPPDKVKEVNPILALRLSTEILEFSGLTPTAVRKIKRF